MAASLRAAAVLGAQVLPGGLRRVARGCGRLPSAVWGSFLSGTSPRCAFRSPEVLLLHRCVVKARGCVAGLRFVPQRAEPHNVLEDTPEPLCLPIGGLYGRLIWSREG